MVVDVVKNKKIGQFQVICMSFAGFIHNKTFKNQAEKYELNIRQNN